MQKTNTRRGFTHNVVNKNCHSRGMLSGISRIRLRKQAENFCLKTTKQKGDPRQKPSGMTALWNGGFTLIELLVVVLIIGILATVALPQYQKAVIKSRYASLKDLVNSIAQAQEVYYLANGKYATNFEELDISMPDGMLDSSSEGNYQYNWGWCNIAVNGGSPICLDDKAEMAYQVYLIYNGNQTKYCIAYNTSSETDIRAQICKAETGKTTYKHKEEGKWINWNY